MEVQARFEAPPARKSSFVEQIADEAVLREAWYRVQRGGRAGGVDGVTVDAFRPRAEEQLRQLRELLLGNAYEPSPVRRVPVPKPSGGVRVLGLPTIGDRIAQTAAAPARRSCTRFSRRSWPISVRCCSITASTDAGTRTCARA